jgi:hypothetical protein
MRHGAAWLLFVLFLPPPAQAAITRIVIEKREPFALR